MANRICMVRSNEGGRQAVLSSAAVGPERAWILCMDFAAVPSWSLPCSIVRMIVLSYRYFHLTGSSVFGWAGQTPHVDTVYMNQSAVLLSRKRISNDMNQPIDIFIWLDHFIFLSPRSNFLLYINIREMHVLWFFFLNFPLSDTDSKGDPIFSLLSGYLPT